MSILTKPLGKPKAPKQDAPAEAGAVVSTRPAKVKTGTAPALAMSPRANLLPPEINENLRRKATRRGLRFVVVAAVVVAVAGVGGSWFYAQTAQQSMAAEQQRTVQLAKEKADYADVSETTQGIALGKAAVKVGGSTDIDWSDYLAKLQGTLPAGVTLTSVSVVSANITTPFEQSTLPLEGQRIATLSFTAKSSTLPSIPDWIDGLSGLPGFADASPNSVTQTEDGYTAGVTMHIDTDAYSYRYDPAAKKEAGK
jgi:Tfp pilus assembly protein PilN